ncbi:MAG TPA: tetratricopeptide repeat protein, partial [Caldimonas sp.]
RRGDVLLAQGKSSEAQAAYLKAWTAMDPKIDYRRLIEAKLNLLGVQPAASAASGAEASK